ncbi:MAG TPA: HD domain-containing phosphohydrolase, partial [Rhodocyclaceae bacterium]|nr:HD domain-containing phosphohydrolase [Rhodocyclaceae bacterium]
FDNVQRYVAGMLAEFSSLAQLTSHKVLIVARVEGEAMPRVVAVNGEWDDIVDGDFPPFIALPAAVTELVGRSLAQRSACEGDAASTMMVSGHGVDLVAWAGGKQAFAQADLLLLEVFLLKVCQAVANHHVFQVVSNERDAFAQGVASYAERWDPQAERVLDRLANLSRRLAQRLQTTLAFGDQIDTHFMQNIGGAARLHDLGNLSLPLELLRKPAAWTAEERMQMQEHVAAGRQWLAPLREKVGAQQGIIDFADTVIASHHERYDGSGYPLGLRGEDIPLAGRVVAVADVWVALTSARSHRAALTPEHARETLAQEAGRFDPQVLEALFFVLDHDTPF